MTTLVVNDREVESIISQYGKEMIIEYIKTFTPKSRVKQVDDLDSRLRALKPVNKEGGEKLRNAFSSLNSKLVSLQHIDIEHEKQAYFDKKYSL